MFPMEVYGKNMLNNKDIMTKFSLLIAIIALVVTSYSVWEQVRDKSPEIKVSVLAQDKVTDFGNIDGLIASYSFNGVAIQDLWKFRVRFQNVGDSTIIGQGGKSNLLKDAIEFAFPKGYRIIDLNEFKDGVRATVQSYDERFFKINFEQWRSEELLDVDLFLEQVDSTESTPTIILASRSLIDGKFTISHDSSFDVVKRKSLLNLPTPLVELASQFVRWSKVLLFALLVYIVIVAPLDCFKYYKWKKEFKHDYDSHIDTLFSGEEFIKMCDVIKLYKDDPIKAPNWVWESFSGEKAVGVALFPTAKPAVIFISMCWLFVIATVASLIG